MQTVMDDKSKETKSFLRVATLDEQLDEESSNSDVVSVNSSTYNPKKVEEVHADVDKLKNEFRAMGITESFINQHQDEIQDDSSPVQVKRYDDEDDSVQLKKNSLKY